MEDYVVDLKFVKRALNSQLLWNPFSILEWCMIVI